MRRLRTLLLLPLAASLGGCDAAILNPAGDIAVQQRNLIFASTGLMLLIILPVMAFTLIFAWRYRASNTDAAYDPDWHHSTQLEVLIWTAPLLIIIALGALTWISTHVLDPYRKLDRLAAGTAVAADAKPLRVDVVALDWKWLFLYPDQGIATVNELAAPVDVPIEFHITSASVMNSFFVPSLAGQIYAMAGMETKLHAVVNREGVFDGMSANYSGAGFSKMNFKFHAVSQGDFDAWVAKAKQSGQTLDRPAYVALEKPSEAVPVRYFSGVETGLFNAVLNMCAEPGKMCMSQMMHLDAMGGGGKESGGNLDRLRYDNRRIQEGDEPSGATFPASGRAPRSEDKTDGTNAGQGGQAKPGMDHTMPGMQHDTPAPDQINK